jgi:prephenate dehydrogenase
MMHRFNKVAIVGVGLIGGSFALALKKAQAANQIVGIGRSSAVLSRAHTLGIIDTIATSIEQTVSGADLVLIAAPVAQTSQILASIAPILEPATIVTDAGSTKSDVVAAAYAALGDKVGQFVPGHPIAGSEANGPDAATAELYFGKKIVLTPLPENPISAVEKVASAWQQCGATTYQLSPERHDRVFAAVSHLPHLLAYALVDQIDRSDDANLLFQFAASGFRDFTRIAGSSPEMWRDIALANRSALMQEIDVYSTRISSLKIMLDTVDSAGLLTMFSNAQRARQDWLNAIDAVVQQP